MADINDLIDYEDRCLKDKRKQLLAWINTTANGDTWRGHCLRFWLSELNGLAGVW